MASEWVELFDTDDNVSVFVNLSNASSIYPQKPRGSVIWFPQYLGETEEYNIHVREDPKEIIQKVREV